MGDAKPCRAVKPLKHLSQTNYKGDAENPLEAGALAPYFVQQMRG